MFIKGFEKMLKSQVVYYIKNEKKKEIYIGQTERDGLTRLGEHLSTYSTVRKYIESNKLEDLEIDVLFEYKKHHKNIKELLDKKETYFIKEYAKKGYTLINQKKVKNI